MVLRFDFGDRNELTHASVVDAPDNPGGFQFRDQVFRVGDDITTKLLQEFCGADCASNPLGLDVDLVAVPMPMIVVGLPAELQLVFARTKFAVVIHHPVRLDDFEMEVTVVGLRGPGYAVVDSSFHGFIY